MKYTLKIIFVILAAAALLVGVIWIFSSTERQFALNQYIDINKTSSNSVQYAVQDNIAKWTDEGGNVDYVGLVNNLPKHDFNSVSILNKNGTVIASTDDSIKGAYINSLGDKGIEAFYETNGAYIIQNGNAYYFAEILSDDYRVMCIILQSNLLATQTKISLINIVEVLVLLLIASIAITLTIIFYKQRFNVLYKVKPVNNYTLSTTKSGKFLYADKNFNETFKNIKFSECFIEQNKPLREALTSGNLLLFSMKNKNDETIAIMLAYKKIIPPK